MQAPPVASPVLDIRASRAQTPIDAKPFLEWTFRDGALWTSFYRVEHGYLLRFPDLADFTVSANGHAVAAFPVPGLAAQTIEHLYLNQVQPLALSRQGKFILHASAVEAGEFAIAFLGLSGRGKSTLAASFSTGGYRFLTDDALQLETGNGGYLVRPSHPSIRLWDDSRRALIPESTETAPPVVYTNKARLLAGGEVAYCESARPLCRVYFLGEGKAKETTITPISGRDAMVELVRHSFLLDIEAREMLSHHFGLLADLVEMPLCFSLDYPRRYEELPRVREAVLFHAGHLRPAGSVAASIENRQGC
jgi:hypothetical protein